jgi:hypothetical protein
MRNARNSQDYDFDKVVSQVSDFLFSDRGTFIREKLVDELVNAIDVFGRNTWLNFSNSVRQQLGLTSPTQVNSTQVNSSNSQNFEHLKNIWAILQETRGFDPIVAVYLVSQLLIKKETQQMSQKVLEGLGQKLAARLIKSLLVDSDYSQNGTVNNNKGYTPEKKPGLALPSSSIKG